MNILLNILLLFYFPAHDVHLSKTDLHYKSEKQALQFTIHIYMDDLELEIKNESQHELKLFSDKESPLADSLIVDYLDKHLKIQIDQNSVNRNYIGKEMSEDLMAVWIYLEVENQKKFEHIKIENTILTDLYYDQRNILNFKVDNKRKAFYILDSKDQIKDIDL